MTTAIFNDLTVRHSWNTHTTAMTTCLSLFQEAWINTLVTAEVVCWFFVGECIGKRSLIGYNV